MSSFFFDDLIYSLRTALIVKDAFENHSENGYSIQIQRRQTDEVSRFIGEHNDSWAVGTS